MQDQANIGAALLNRALRQLVCLIDIVRFAQMRNHIRGRSIPRFRLPEEQRISCAQGTRQSYLVGRVTLTEEFMVTGAPVGCREIHAAAKLGQGKGHGEV
jgi:hypothetical protein